jgi:hypothetical protein
MIWTGNMLGRGYLGPVVRTRVAGNTPPLFIPDGDWTWPRPEALGNLELFRHLAQQAGATSAVSLQPPDPHVELTTWRQGDQLRIVAIHTGPGMSYHRQLKLPAGYQVEQVKPDFRDWSLEQQSDGSAALIALPPFADCCTVSTQTSP